MIKYGIYCHDYHRMSMLHRDQIRALLVKWDYHKVTQIVKMSPDPDDRLGGLALIGYHAVAHNQHDVLSLVFQLLSEESQKNYFRFSPILCSFVIKILKSNDKDSLVHLLALITDHDFSDMVRDHFENIFRPSHESLHIQ